jgi:hypothetical protein
MKTYLTLALLAMQVAVSWGQGTDQAGPPPGSGKRLCLCSFSLDGTASTVASAIPVPESVLTTLKIAQQSYETILKEATAFLYMSNDKIIVTQDNGRPLSLADATVKNGLFACVSAGSFWGVQPGWNKKVVIRTTWVVVGPGGCKAKIVTTVVSKETYGKFPNVASDPKLVPVYLELAKVDARQFLEALPASMKKAGCSLGL